MANDRNGVSDAVAAELNPDPDAAVHNPDAKGPDPAQWDDIEARDEGDFDPFEDGVKGPDPAQWGSDATKE